MVDTPRTKPSLISLFSDIIPGGITPQSGRDLISTAVLDDLYNVKSYGAVGDGVTNDTVAIQAAITAAYSAGGGTVYFPPGKYSISTAITVLSNVRLRGTFGLPDPRGGPTNIVFIYVPNSAVTPVQITGPGVSIEGITFYYPNQVVVTAATPTAYPATITTADSCAGVRIRDCCWINAYDAISMITPNQGRVWIEDCLIGAYHEAINADQFTDTLYLSNLWIGPVWLLYPVAVAYPQTIDTWVKTNATAITLKRLDGCNMNGILAFGQFRGILGTHSASGASILMATNIHLDGGNEGLVVQDTQGVGWDISNLHIQVTVTPNNFGIVVASGGTNPPVVRIHGGEVAPTSNGIPVVQQAGDLSMIGVTMPLDNINGGDVLVTGGSTIRLTACQFPTSGARPSIVLPNAWAGTAIIVANSLGARTYTPPGILPTKYVYANNI